MILPKNERRAISQITKRVLWVYGAPFSGKTTFANQFPDPLMLNTDGNVKFVDAPFIPIRNEVKVEGRIKKTTLAWEVFKQAIDELEKKDNTFKTVIVDLLEDMYEHCRIYMYRELGITHESDDSFKAWDMVRTEFLSTLKRLMNLDYENIILISHEDTSKDITKRGGDKITAIKPNLQEKPSNKVAGMVDIVGRVIAEGNTYTLSFKTSEVIFGGGRLAVADKEIPLDFEAFIQVYENAQNEPPAKSEAQPPKPTGRTGRKPPVKPVTQPEPQTLDNPPPAKCEYTGADCNGDGDCKECVNNNNHTNPEGTPSAEEPAPDENQEPSPEPQGEDNPPPAEPGAKPPVRTRRRRT